MKTAKLKYGCKLGKVFYPSGTEVEVCDSDDSRVLSMFPNIKSHPDSDQVAIIFPNRNTPTIHSKDHVILRGSSPSITE